MIDMENVLDRFLRYSRIYTTSDPESETFPSTSRQLTFADSLAKELLAIGLKEVERDHYGYVTGTSKFLSTTTGIILAAALFEGLRNFPVEKSYKLILLIYRKTAAPTAIMVIIAKINGRKDFFAEYEYSLVLVLSIALLGCTKALLSKANESTCSGSFSGYSF